MGTKITFSQVKAYLDAVATNPNNSGDITQSPHGSFWQVDYNTFTNGNVPGGPQVLCNGSPIPIIDKADATQSGFFVILTSGNGYCKVQGGQMPEGGPFITDTNPPYQVSLADGTVVTGATIMADLLEWLKNGYPEHGN